MTAMTDPTTVISDLIDLFLDEQDRAALEQACRLAASTPTLDMSELLRRVRTARAEQAVKAEALRRLRAALQLPAMPGPACRPQPFD